MAGMINFSLEWRVVGYWDIFILLFQTFKKNKKGKKEKRKKKINRKFEIRIKKCPSHPKVPERSPNLRAVGHL